MTGFDTLKKRLTPAEQLERLSAQRAALAQREARLKKQLAQTDHKTQTHRKILVGVALLAEVAEVNGGAWLADLLRRRLTARDLAHPSVADLLLAHGTAPQAQAQQSGEAGENG